MSLSRRNRHTPVQRKTLKSIKAFKKRQHELRGALTSPSIYDDSSITLFMPSVLSCSHSQISHIQLKQPVKHRLHTAGFNRIYKQRKVKPRNPGQRVCLLFSDAEFESSNKNWIYVHYQSNQLQKGALKHSDLNQFSVLTSFLRGRKQTFGPKA